MNQGEITSKRINSISRLFGFKRYLEIGVQRGDTFFNVDMPHKTAVDPNFQFNIEEHQSQTIRFFPIPSDTFFQDFARERQNSPYRENGEELFTFDIIFIDGLHTFEQSYRDFINSIQYSHEKTVWILDDTVPSDPWSCIPDMKKSHLYRRMANIADLPWHGDVFKTVFAIHDNHPDFCYATQMNDGNPQTILWKTPEQYREKIFKDIDEISHFTYFDLLDRAWIICLTEHGSFFL